MGCGRQPTLDDNEKPVEIRVYKRFRRFVQIVDAKKVCFKEFGDPRTLNYKTGIFDDKTDPDQRANSMILFENYCSYTEYGLPRFLGQLLNIQGNRKAEELNYTYFSDGRHIPLAVIVENCKLTDESIQLLQEIKGDVARHKYLTLEAEGLEGEIQIGDEDKRSGVKIHLDPLVHVLEKDGLFQEYCNNNRGKIRSAFRLHPIYTGESQDYTRATADTARQITEEQVFQPERDGIAFKLNKWCDGKYKDDRRQRSRRIKKESILYFVG